MSPSNELLETRREGIGSGHPHTRPVRWKAPLVKKRELQKVADEIAAKWESRPFVDLAALTYPVTFVQGSRAQRNFIQIEVCLLEKDENLIHLSISVDDGGFRSFFPVTSSVIVKRP